MVVARFDVFLVTLDPTQGSEIRKTRPSLIISPASMNHAIKYRHNCADDHSGTDLPYAR